MNEQQPTIDEAIEETCGCPGCLTIPVSALALEVDVPLGGWSDTFDRMEIKILTDPAGRPAITTLAARRLLNALRRRDELAVEARDRIFKKVAAQHPVPVSVGVPALEGMSVTPEQEFGGRPKPRFLQDELEAGARAQAEERRLADERAKERLADQMKDRLGGKR